MNASPSEFENCELAFSPFACRFFDLYETPLDQTDTRLSIIHTEACSGASEQRSTSVELAPGAFRMSDRPQS